MLLVSTYARSLKEANTYLTPVTLIAVLLSVITMLWTKYSFDINDEYSYFKCCCCNQRNYL